MAEFRDGIIVSRFILQGRVKVYLKGEAYFDVTEDAAFCPFVVERLDGR